MGGSLALALAGKCKSLMGVDPDPIARSLAEQRAIADLISADPADLLPQADLVVLAAPVRVIVSQINDLPHLHPGSAVVLDLGSTKQEISAAMQSLPERFDPVGGHPMCGKEYGTLVHAEASLYRNAQFILTEVENTTLRARQIVLELVNAVEAVPVWLDAGAHDRLVAATSHLPYLAANALAFTTPFEAAALTGPGFRSAARLAVTPRRMMMDILITNQENILQRLSGYRQHLERIEQALALGDFSALEDLLGQGAFRYEALIERQANQAGRKNSDDTHSV
jgi:prephenate dehydrogenase